jgi:hypothetical protein
MNSCASVQVCNEEDKPFDTFAGVGLPKPSRYSPSCSSDFFVDFGGGVSIPVTVHGGVHDRTAFILSTDEGGKIQVSAITNLRRKQPELPVHLL